MYLTKLFETHWDTLAAKSYVFSLRLLSVNPTVICLKLMTTTVLLGQI